MILEIDSSELIICLMQKTKEQDMFIPYKRLREIGNKIEHRDHELIVNLNERSIKGFCGNCKRNFSYQSSTIEIKGVQTISVQRIVKKLQPSDRVYKLVEDILEHE